MQVAKKKVKNRAAVRSEPAADRYCPKNHSPLYNASLLMQKYALWLRQPMQQSQILQRAIPLTPTTSSSSIPPSIPASLQSSAHPRATGRSGYLLTTSAKRPVSRPSLPRVSPGSSPAAAQRQRQTWRLQSWCSGIETRREQMCFWAGRSSSQTT